eukprot:m.68356 g.68356  ORF g.68356 m.68356 type:complete len:830 (-) comp11961_c0_seq1:158-2647(-)
MTGGNHLSSKRWSRRSYMVYGSPQWNRYLNYHSGDSGHQSELGGNHENNQAAISHADSLGQFELKPFTRMHEIDRPFTKQLKSWWTYGSRLGWHYEEDSEVKVQSFELFYDLVFVAFIFELAYVIKNDLTWGGYGISALSFFTLWLTWFHVNMIMTRVHLRGNRLFPIYMVCIATVFVATLSQENPTYTAAGRHPLFFIFVTRLCFFLIYAGMMRQKGEVRPLFSKYNTVLLISGIATFTGSVLPDTEAMDVARVFLLLFATCVELVMYPVCDLITDATKRLPVCADHLIERTELWAILVVGESIISLVTTERCSPNIDGTRYYRTLVAALILVMLTIRLFTSSQPKHSGEFSLDVHAFNIPGAMAVVRGWVFNVSNLLSSWGFFGIGVGLKFIMSYNDTHCRYTREMALLLSGSCAIGAFFINCARFSHQWAKGFGNLPGCEASSRLILLSIHMALALLMAPMGLLVDSHVEVFKKSVYSESTNMTCYDKLGFRRKVDCFSEVVSLSCETCMKLKGDTVYEYVADGITHEALIWVLIGFMVVLNIIESLIRPGPVVRSIYEEDTERRLRWKDEKVMKLASLSSRLANTSVFSLESKHKEELQALLIRQKKERAQARSRHKNKALRRWFDATKKILDGISQQKKEGIQNIVLQCLDTKHKNRIIGEGHQEPWDLKEALLHSPNEPYDSLTQKDKQEVVRLYSDSGSLISEKAARYLSGGVPGIILEDEKERESTSSEGHEDERNSMHLSPNTDWAPAGDSRRSSAVSDTIAFPDLGENTTPMLKVGDSSDEQLVARANEQERVNAEDQQSSRIVKINPERDTQVNVSEV